MLLCAINLIMKMKIRSSMFKNQGIFIYSKYKYKKGRFDHHPANVIYIFIISNMKQFINNHNQPNLFVLKKNQKVKQFHDKCLKFSNVIRRRMKFELS